MQIQNMGERWYHFVSIAHSIFSSLCSLDVFSFGVNYNLCNNFSLTVDPLVNSYVYQVEIKTPK